MNFKKSKTTHDLMDDAGRASKSITHTHILSIINTILSRATNTGPIRILDAGCGNCELVSYLETFVPKFHAGLQVEVYGFDILDSKVQFEGYHSQARDMLKNRHADINWHNRIKNIKGKEAWPFDDNTFDIVVSNQVVEHVAHPEAFFYQNWRVLRNNAFAIHLFPVKNYIMEGHIHLPFVHRIRQWNLLYRYIKGLSRLGLGKWRLLKDHCSLDEYSRSYADFLTYYCHYLSIADLLTWGKRVGFRTGFNYTENFYYEKLNQIFRRRHRFFYNKRSPCGFLVHLYKYIQCITLFLEKSDNYQNYIAIHSPD